MAWTEPAREEYRIGPFRVILDTYPDRKGTFAFIDVDTNESGFRTSRFRGWNQAMARDDTKLFESRSAAVDAVRAWIQQQLDASKVALDLFK